MNDCHYYHCATNGEKVDALFPSINAFIAGMNRVATCFIKAKRSSPVLIFAFCLMDTHVHFILYGTKDNCEKFMMMYKTSTEIWFSRHPEEGLGGKVWDFGTWLIPDKDALIQKIIYVLRNPMAAGLPYVPTGYRWGSGSLLFSDENIVKSCSSPLGSFSIHEQRALLNTHEPMPQDWLVLKDGMIWPGNYTEYKRVENLFKTAAAFVYESNKKVEGDVNAEIMADTVSIPDIEVREMALSLAQSLFGKSRIADLSVNQRRKVAISLKKEDGISTKQIARIVRVKYEDLKLLI